MSWFKKHLHRWKCVFVYTYEDTSYDDPGAPSYNATYRCIDCGETKTELEYGGGRPTVEDLNSAIDY